MLKMKIEIIKDIKEIPTNFFIWSKTDLTCPECKKNGLVIKYRCNGKIHYSHNSSGIILACENWGNCKSWWNKGEEYRFPWHTWLSSFHRLLDFQRGDYGLKFLNEIKISNPDIYKKIVFIDQKINKNTEIK